MSLRRGTIVGLSLLASVLLFAAAWQTAALAWTVAAELERATGLADLGPRSQSTIVFDRYGRPAFTYFVEQRIDVPLDRVSPRMIEALLAIEDRRFFSHRGLDPVRVAAAAWRNLRAGRIIQGGSTLTQQLARTAQLSPERTFERKLREAMIAAQLEQRYSKTEILEAYLNTVYFGGGYYGVEAASRGYFGKPAAELKLHEAALLAAIVRSPSRDAPGASPGRARARRDLVLQLMNQQQKISASELQLARSASIPPASAVRLAATATPAGGSRTGLYFQEELRRQLVVKFGNDRVLRGGLRVYSTYDPDLQAAAEEAISGRIAQIAASRRTASELQGSLVSLDAQTGDVLALVGGRDFLASPFNRATQSRRQAGSAFKPILYAAALERGYTPATMLTDLDVPIGTAGVAWLPGGEHEGTEYTLRQALQLSSNRAAVQLMQQIGASTTIYYAQRLGIESPLPPVPSLALGTGDVTLVELTAAYTAFANRGTTSMPRLFIRVEDGAGTIVFDNLQRHTQAISEATAFMMSSMLADVVARGTAGGVRGAGFRLPAGGKTGTTDDYADAWFIGYTPHVVTGVWFGMDTPTPIMTRGFAGVVAVPAWARFMKRATRGAGADWFEMPADVERVAICRASGARAAPACRHQYVLAATGPGVTGAYDAPRVGLPEAEPPVYDELFPRGVIPSELCPIHGQSPAEGGHTGPPSADSSTPLVDAELRRPILQRVVGRDGVTRVVIKQPR